MVERPNQTKFVILFNLGCELESFQDFLIELDMKPCMHGQTYQNYKQPPQTSQNSDFQSHYSMWKIDQIFPKKNSLNNIGPGDQLLIKTVFENFDF